MREHHRLSLLVCITGIAVCCGFSTRARANVYPSGVIVDASSFGTICGTVKVQYVLNEDADGTSSLPGVKIQVLDASDTAIRTVTIARQKKGLHVFEWDGRKDDGVRASMPGAYKFRITAADFGYGQWTQISLDQTSTSFWGPRGIAVNKNPASPHYGKIYVTNGTAGVTAAVSRDTQDGVYVMWADTSEILFTAGGRSWPGANSPHKCTIGPDDRFYTADLTNDLAFEFSEDMTTSTQLIDASNRTSNQWVASMIVEGTLAEGNRKIYLVNSNYNDTARKGVVMYNLRSQGGVVAGDTGTQYMGPGYFNYYPQDAARDAEGNWYLGNYRADPNLVAPVAKFLDGTPPLNTPVWEASKDYTYPYGYDVSSSRKWVAYGQYATGFVYLFNTDTGSFVANFDAGSRVLDVAFDDAGNIYTVDNIIEWLRVWSPPDGENSKATTTASIELNKPSTGGPSISTQPQDALFCPGGTANFTVVASGAGSVTYQWKKNGTLLSNDGVNVLGATTNSLTLNNVPGTEAGQTVQAIVCDSNGVTVSDLAILRVGISFVQAPLSQTACQGTNPIFSVAATGKGVLSYQWQKDNAGDGTFADIVGQTGTSLTLTNVPQSDSGTRFRVAVRDDCNPAPADPVYSSAAVLTVKGGPVLSHVGYGGPVAVGGSRTMVCYASGTGILHFQWKKDGIELPGATSSGITLTNVTCANSGLYSCVVTDDCNIPVERSTDLAGGEARITVTSTEVCNNGVDDDCDGISDCEDSDCDLSPQCVPPCNDPFADADGDHDVDMDDFGAFQVCFTGQGGVGFNRDACYCFDRDANSAIESGPDLLDFLDCASAPAVPADPGCDNFPSGNVVINEVQYDEWTTVEAVDNREFVELYNSDPNPVNISGWLLRAPTMSGKDILIPGTPGIGSTIIPGHGYYVIGSALVSSVNLTISPATDFWDNDREAFELVDANRTVKDTVVYELNAGAFAGLTAQEGGLWGPFVSTSATRQSWARWVDGVDTGNNGRDFGLRTATPGATNDSIVVTAYVPPDVNAQGAGGPVNGLTGSFVGALVANPADITTLVGADDLNPNVIPPSPQGGNVIIAWDPSGGGNAVVSNDIMTGNGGYDLWVYLDTSDITIAGAETTAYGIMGTVDPLFNTPDAGGTVLPTTNVTLNGCTGLAWIFQKDNAGNVKRLFLVDAGAGGDSSPNGGSMDWVVQQNIDMSAVASGWYRLSISYTGTTGAVVAKFGAQTFNFSTAAGLKGGFYIGYRESLAATPATLRPPTFDLVP